MPNIPTYQGYNPDILTCLANLSSDEVFTPPQLANDLLDLLPPSIWQDQDARFLDPACKSGVFLREIVKRLYVGLEQSMPNPQARANHIFTQQIFGYALTELTALMARRSVYGSKTANGVNSLCTGFDDKNGHIWLPPVRHDWKNGRCRQCGANQETYDRADGLETYAYPFLHGSEQELTTMRFDVIIGNPPYQLSDGGGKASAMPIYQKFVQQAKKLNPRYLTMIIPSRWFGGGKGLDEFRGEMLKDQQIRKIVDFEDANECFPGVDIAGGICYFLWEKDSAGECEFVNVHKGVENKSQRLFGDFDILVRHAEAVAIINKIKAKNEKMMNDVVSSSKPFGLRTFVRPKTTGDIKLRWQNGEGPYPSNEITTGVELIDKWKVITSYVGYDHAGNPGKDGKRKVFAKIDILPPGTICNETYLVIDSFDDKKPAENLITYMKTKFFRFLVSQLMFSHHITKESYRFVPHLDMTQPWTDEALYQRYDLSPEDIAFIDSKIRPME